jgi:hypothetical protein
MFITTRTTTKGQLTIDIENFLHCLVIVWKNRTTRPKAASPPFLELQFPASDQWHKRLYSLACSLIAATPYKLLLVFFGFKQVFCFRRDVFFASYVFGFRGCAFGCQRPCKQM